MFKSAVRKAVVVGVAVIASLGLLAGTAAAYANSVTFSGQGLLATTSEATT